MAELSLVGLVESGPCCFVGGWLDTASLCWTDVACRSLRVANEVSWHERELGSRVSFGVELNENGALKEIMGAGVKIGGQQLAGWKVGYMSRQKRTMEEHLMMGRNLMEEHIPTQIGGWRDGGWVYVEPRMTRAYPRVRPSLRSMAARSAVHHSVLGRGVIILGTVPRQGRVWRNVSL